MADNVKSDYEKTGSVSLKSSIYSVILFLEKGPVILNNSDIYELFFIEDIFKFCIVGKISFNDRYNILEYGPWTGNEKLEIIYSVGTNNRDLVFDIWKIGNIQQLTSGPNETAQNLISMNFVDPFFIPYSLRKYSKSWIDKKYSSIMEDILNNMVFMKDIQKMNVEESSNNTDFIIPYWTPITAMRFLMRRGKGRKSGTSGYLCFNNTENGFKTNLITMNYLLEDLGRTMDVDTYHMDTAEVSSKNKIMEWWISGVDKASNAVIRGGTWRGFDFTTKQLLNREFTYQDGVDNTFMLGKKTLYTNIDDTTSVSTLVSDGTEDGLFNIAYNDWVKRYNLQFIVNFIVEGDEKRFAGQQIEVEWKSPSLDQFNDQLKGKYLIKSVTHQFIGSGNIPYKQRLVLIKNAYHNSKCTYLVDSKKLNRFTEKNLQVIRKG
jgi:hypothetical protein